ncbi:MAG: hypothetical protein QM610_15175 [Chitinophagaceae bacterium]
MNMAIPIQWNGGNAVRGFMGIYFEAQTAIDSGPTRNTGIFVEGPMYNFLLCYAMIIETFFKKTINYRRCIILTLVIFSTLSTTGLLFLTLLLGIKFLTRKSKSKFGVLIKGISIPIILGISIFLMNYILNEKANSGRSYEVRMEYIQKSIDDWKKNPMLGNGYGNYGQSDMGGSSNSTFLILGEGGLVLFSFYIFLIVIVPTYTGLKTRNYNFIYASLLFFLVFTVTIIYFNLVANFFIGLWASILVSRKSLFWTTSYQQDNAPNAHKRLKYL